MKILNARAEHLKIGSLSTTAGQSWCFVGANRSGLRLFFDLICSSLPRAEAECLELPENLSVVSFKRQQEIYELEVKNDDTDYLDRLDPGTLARDFLTDAGRFATLIDKFNLSHVLDQGYRQLSTGQTRKLLLLSQITRGRSALAIQAPFEGLDAASRKEVSNALSHLADHGIELFLFVHNLEDIPSWCTHLGLMAAGKLSVQGEASSVRSDIENGMSALEPDFKARVQALAAIKAEPARVPELVRLVDGTAGYGAKPVFEAVSLTMAPGDHTLVTGPNGCGKSTLLQVITGDHPACYQNDLTLFGIRRGSGESIWELKQQMGIVSPELHRNHYIPGPVIHCILSGLFDSIGLYRPYTRQQAALAHEWLERLGMEEKAGLPFRDLTFADQRLVLIARALVKMPALLILDEPTQGLDQSNRNALLDFLQDLAKEKLCTILYVSHREDEFRPFFVQQIDMS